MRYYRQKNYEIIKLTDGSDLSAKRTLKESDIHKRTFCNWYKRYFEGGYDGLASKATGCLQTLFQDSWLKPDDLTQAISKFVDY